MKKSQDQINAFLGRETEFEGKLSFAGTVRIDGRFKGEIASDGTLVVGETAVLECDIRCARILISGEIRGNIFSQERIEIQPAREGVRQHAGPRGGHERGGRVRRLLPHAAGKWVRGGGQSG